MAETKVLRQYSFDGYSLKEWLKRNKSTIKLIIAGVGGVIASTFSTSAYVQLLFGSGGALVTKLIVDSFDYWASK